MKKAMLEIVRTPWLAVRYYVRGAILRMQGNFKRAAHTPSVGRAWAHE